jgi:hypothetical protein
MPGGFFGLGKFDEARLMARQGIGVRPLDKCLERSDAIF